MQINFLPWCKRPVRCDLCGIMGSSAQWHKSPVDRRRAPAPDSDTPSRLNPKCFRMSSWMSWWSFFLNMKKIMSVPATSVWWSQLTLARNAQSPTSPSTRDGARMSSFELDLDDTVSAQKSDRSGRSGRHDKQNTRKVVESGKTQQECWEPVSDGKMG